jgi:hypothetical protein
LLFNIKDDPLEMHNLVKTYPEVSEEKSNDLLDWERANEKHTNALGRSMAESGKVEDDAQLRKHLRDLGYLE